MLSTKATLTAEDLDVLYGISRNLGLSKSRFNALCMTYRDLTEAQRKLYLDLLNRFTYIPFSHYPEELEVAVSSMLKTIPHKNLLIYNGMAHKDYGKVKSNYLISYQFKGSNLKTNVDFDNRQVKVIDSIKELLKCDLTEDDALILVDDFVGSGDTIEKAFDYISKRLEVYGKVVRTFAVVCLVAMERAVLRLADSGIEVFASRILQRGISDYYKGDELTESIKLMEEIERKHKVRKAYRFGYGASESLVCMERCPNNTFGIFSTGQNAVFRR